MSTIKVTAVLATAAAFATATAPGSGTAWCVQSPGTATDSQ